MAISSSRATFQDSTSAAYEEEHVHQVYESIASHFSQTRYKPWPLVAAFLDVQPMGSIGLDLGSGNGKYLHGRNITNVSLPSQNLILPSPARSSGLVPEKEAPYFMVGLDRSSSLLSLSRNSNSLPELIHGDCLSLPFRSTFNFDFAISIATLHHFSTPERRLEAMKLFLSVVKPTLPGRIGRALVFVWAHEQGEKSRRNWTKGTLLPAPMNVASSDNSQKQDIKDLEELSKLQDVLVPWVTHKNANPGTSPPLKTYNRYYHLFREGELNELVELAAQSLELSFEIVSSLSSSSVHQTDWCLIKHHGWEADNWWAEIEVGCARRPDHRAM